MLKKILEDFSDKVVFDDQDERWPQLLRIDSLHYYLNMKNDEKSCFRELFMNNHYTQNFQRLVDVIVGRIKLIERQKGPKPLATLIETCSGMCLISLILQAAVEKLSPTEAMTFMSLRSNPDNVFIGCGLSDGYQSAMDRLLVAVTNILCTVDESLVDIQFFSANIWILFIHMNDNNLGVDFFYRALHSYAVIEMQQALANPANSYAFTSCMSVRLVRSLLYLSVNAKEEHLHSNAFVNRSLKYKMESSRGVILPKLVEVLTKRQSNSLMKAGESNSLLSASKLLGAIQSMFYEFVTRIPVKGLQDFITVSSSHFSIFRDRIIGVLPLAARNTTTSWEGNNDKFQGKQLKSFFPQETFAQLLLLLLHHRSFNSFNPFRQAFSYLADLEMDSGAMGEEQDIEMLNMRGAPTALSVNYVHVNLRLIVEVITDMLPNPSFLLLLYSFLQMHPTFLETLRQMDVSRTIILNLLRGVYRACSLPAHSSASAGTSTHDATTTTSPTAAGGAAAETNETQENNLSHLYTLSVCLLIMIQDTMLFPRYAAEVVTMPWYKERPSSSMKLLDAVVVVMLRALSFAVFRVQDSYLLSNICAILMNVIPSCRDLHPYASERIVRTIFTFCRRIVKTHQHQHILQQQQQQQQQQKLYRPNSSSLETSTVATTVLSSTTPKFIQRGAHKWQVSYDNSMTTADAHDHLHGSAMDNNSHLRLPSLASASLDYSYHNSSHTSHQDSSSLATDSSQSQHYSQQNQNPKRRPSITSLSGNDYLPEVDIALMQVTLMTLIQFSVATLKSRITESTYFLYALISDYASLLRYFPHTIVEPVSDANNASIETDAAILAEHENSTEWRTLYEDMQAVTAITEYYLLQFENLSAKTKENDQSNRNNSSDGTIGNGENYFTAKQAAQFLKGQILRHHQPSSISHASDSMSSALSTIDPNDVEGGGSGNTGYQSPSSSSFAAVSYQNESAAGLQQQQEVDSSDNEKYQILLYRLHRGYVPSSASSSSLDDYYRARYCYQEAENAAEFFVPYIWSNVINLVGND